MDHVLFFGEGVTDVGAEGVRTLVLTADGVGADTGAGELCGVIPILVLRSVAEASGAPGLSLRGKSVFLPRMHVKGFARKVKAAITTAAFEKASAIVVVVDRGGEKNRGRLAELRKGREDAVADGLLCPAALGLAIEELEAWLLADEVTLSSVTAQKIAGVIGEPEAQADPKSILAGYCHGRADGLREGRLHDEIALKLDLGKLRKRCPKGFGPFYDEVTKNLSHLTGG